MGSQCCVEPTTTSGFEPYQPTIKKYPQQSRNISIVSHSPPPYTMIVTRTSMPNNDRSQVSQDFDFQDESSKNLANIKPEEHKPVYSFKKGPSVEEPKINLLLEDRPRRQSATDSINSKLYGYEHRFLVVAPSLDNQSVIRRLQYEDPQEAMFSGIPIFEYSQRQPRQSYSSPSSQTRSLFYKKSNSHIK